MALRSGIVFIGDEVSAAGYRLAGAEILAPDASHAALAFDDALGRAEMILVTAQYARHIPEARLRDAQNRYRPLVSVVADIRGREHPADLDAEVRAILGLET